MSSKFDTIYENLLWSLREDVPLDPDFKSNVLGLVNALINKKYIQQENGQDPDSKQIETIVAHAVEDRKINLDGLGALSPKLQQHNPSLPPIILNIGKDNGFSVTLIDTSKPKGDSQREKTFTGENIESIYTDVTTTLQSISVQQEAPEAAVQQLPPATGANAQPAGETTPPAQPGEEGGASALPGV